MAGREEMRRVIGELESSGKSLAAFAGERGLSRWTLYKWRRRVEGFREEAAGGERFVELRIAGVDGAAGTIAVELKTGVRLQVPRGFEEDHLRRLVAVLLSC
jgi:transposase-like protein